MNIFKSKSVTVDMVFNMKATTGQQPYQFGRGENGLLWEARPIPGEQTVSGIEEGSCLKEVLEVRK